MAKMATIFKRTLLASARRVMLIQYVTLESQSVG
jgi:hypothetical protein